MNIKTTIVGGLVITAIAFTALAHSGASGIVKERMDTMSAMGAGLKRIFPMMQGKVTYDASVVNEVATDIGKHTGETLTKLFPAGSGGGHSEAKPDVWNDWDGFAALAMRLDTLSKGLALASANSLAKDAKQQAMQATVKGDAPLEVLAELPPNAVFFLIRDTCAACHDQYREKK